MKETVRELYLSNARLPAIVNHSARDRFRDDFIIRVICHIEILGSRHTILSKRTSSNFGNRPGVILHIHGARVELLTFGDGDTRWHCLVGKRNSIKAGQRYEILAGRRGGKGILYLDGIPNVDFTNNLSCDLPGFAGGISSGDVNCDEPLYIGMHRFNGRNYWRFDGQIEFLGIYNNYELPRGLLRYPPHKTWMYASDMAERIPPSSRRIFTP